MQVTLRTNKGQLIQGDNLEVMKTFQDENFDNCISDFPYNLGFMSKKWDSQNNFYDWNYERALELYRILKKGGYALIFGHHKTNHRMKCAFEDAGFQIVEEIDWIYGSGFPKNQDISKLFDKKAKVKRKGTGEYNNSKGIRSGKNNLVGDNYECKGYEITLPSTDLAKQWNGWKTSGLKPAKEIITIFQKPLDENYCNNIEKYNCGAMNIDVCRVEYKNNKDLETIKAKCNFTKKSKSIGFGTKDSLYGVGKTPLEQARNCVKEQGRFPANVIFDNNMGKVLDSRSEISKSTGKLGNEDGVSRYFLNINFEKDDFTPFYYCPKPTKKEKGTDNKHITVKPKKLIKWLIKLVTPINGKSLDITAGSCTHGLCCEELNNEEEYNIEWTNIELFNDEENPYCNIGKERINTYLQTIQRN